MCWKFETYDCGKLGFFRELSFFVGEIRIRNGKGVEGDLRENVERLLLLVRLSVKDATCRMKTFCLGVEGFFFSISLGEGINRREKGGGVIFF